MEQPAEPIAAAETIQWQPFFPNPFADQRRLRKRRLLGERAVRPVLVVVLRVDMDDTLEVAAAESQQPVETFAAQTADPALGMRTRPAAPAPAPG